MVRKIILLCLLITVNTYSQQKYIKSNDSLIIVYVKEYVGYAKYRGLDINIMNKVDFIIIAPDSVEIANLGVSYKDKRGILISSKVRIDRVILKAILYRELSYMLGVPYNGNIIMNRKREEWFSYACLSDPEIMGIEMDRVMELLRFRK